MTRQKRIFLASPHMGGLETYFINEAFSSNWIAPLGPNVDAFERELAEYVGIKSAAALSSGTAAIHMALKSLGVGRGDVVFCSDLTFSGSCNPIIYQNAEPVFIDSEPQSWNMSPVALETAMEDYADRGRLPKAVIVVDLYGQSADMDQIRNICRRYSVPIVEDAAEALAATYKGRHCGTMGDIGVYSFNGNKIITTSGGGMLVSDDEKAVSKVRFWATQARDSARHYQHSELGYNYRISNVLAGIGRGQLRVLEQRLKEKKNIYFKYKKGFEEISEIEMMPISKDGEPNYWLSVITLRDGSVVKPLDIVMELEKYNIESRPVWKPMHLQPFFSMYKFYSHSNTETSISEDIFNRGVCIPSDTKMTEEDINRVIEIVKNLFLLRNFKGEASNAV